MAEYMLARYHRRRNEFIASQGGICATCGSDGPEFDIDHSDQYSKSSDLAKILTSGSEKRVQAELLKCQLLCKPCHRAKTRRDLAERFNQREHWEHGTLGGYRHCKCVRCKLAMSDYNKARKHAAPMV